ncbi:MAG: hypothetical protein K9G60_05200, partial [Pseudolabrys sp.]|nr:hypothetical protein [Pseudolabrys sp.]
MAETTSGKTAAPTPAKPQPVIAEQPLPDANEAIATNTPLSTPVTAGNDRSVANIHTGNKAEYDPTLVATPDDASSLASNIPTTGLQGNAAPLADASPLGSTNGPSAAGETEPAPVTAPAEGAQVGGNRVALPSSSFTNEVPLTDAGNAATAGTSAASAASTASAVSGGGAGNTDGGGKADDTTVDGNAAVPDVTAPTLTVEATVGDENGNIPVVIDASLSGDNPNEVLTVTVGGLPDGATLSAGTLNPDGTYTLTADQLDGLTLTPATDSGEDFALTVTATATDSETGVNASTDSQLPVTVVEDETATTPDGIANVTAPTLTVEATVGDENGNIPVVIDASLSGDNPNEVLTVTVGGLPDGATLSAGTLNPDGTYTLTEADLVDLTLTPATDSGEDFALTVTATATDSETGVNASTDSQLPVTVVEDETATTPDGIANVTAPTLTVEATVG